MKKIISMVLSFILIFPMFSYADDINTDAKSIILIEANTGTVLYEFNADEALPPASVTKIMTLLLIAEAVDRGEISLEDKVTASAYAASMGGSQIYLKEGEQMSVEDMIKSIVIASANDAAVAMAEYLAGSEAAFVTCMNERASELGMNNTCFENTNGLDDKSVSHVCSARDISIMSKELLKHKWILDYTTIWMDSVREGQFGLTNTNRLIKTYPGANGLKTGSTDKAKFCISATAKRDNMQLIAVIMGASTRDSRNQCAAQVLDYGFSNYTYYCFDSGEICDIPVIGSENTDMVGVYEGIEVVRLKNDPQISCEYIINEKLVAPIAAGDIIGQVVLSSDNETVTVIDIKAKEDVVKMGYFSTLKMLFEKWILL